MLTRIGTPVASAVAAFVLAIALSGAGIGVALVADTISPDDENAPAVVDTTATFEDLDGNGIDDDCQTEPVVAAPEAEASAAAAVDVDKDGTISTSEAAQSDRVGGKNCNHGGYVSGVAKSGSEDEDEDAETEDEDAPAECETSTEPTADEDTEAPEDDGRSRGPERARQGGVRGRAVGRGRRQELQPRRRRQ